MKLMDIDAEHLGIPETNYDADISLPSAEFARIVRDLKELGESVKIEVSKEGVRFSADGDIGSASVTLKATTDRAETMDEDEKKSDDEEEEEEEEKEDDDDDVRFLFLLSPSELIMPKPQVIVEDAEEKPATNEADAEEDEKPELEEDEEEVKPKKKAAKKEKVVEKKRKAPATPVKKGKGGKKAKGEPKKEEEPRRVSISVQQVRLPPLSLSVPCAHELTRVR